MPSEQPAWRVECVSTDGRQHVLFAVTAADSYQAATGALTRCGVTRSDEHPLFVDLYWDGSTVAETTDTDGTVWRCTVRPV